MAIREQVPKSLRGPIGFGSLLIMLFGIVIGYILFTTGLTLFFDLHPIEQGAISKTEGIVVSAVGLATFVAGYVGWRGFNYFAY